MGNFREREERERERKHKPLAIRGQTVVANSVIVAFPVENEAINNKPISVAC